VAFTAWLDLPGVITPADIAHSFIEKYKPLTTTMYSPERETAISTENHAHIFLFMANCHASIFTYFKLGNTNGLIRPVSVAIAPISCFEPYSPPSFYADP
jgi:hypothetical protein